jgi:hypothetical protein
MFKPKKRQVVTLVATFFLLLAPYSPVSATSPLGNDQSDTQYPQVLVKIANNPTDEDKDWPIVGVEDQTFVDPATGKTFTTSVTIRRPSISKPPLKSCPQNDLKTETTIDVNCIYITPESRTGQSTTSGVTVHIKHYADMYCLDTSCTDVLYKPTRVEVYWNRTSTSYTV